MWLQDPAPPPAIWWAYVRQIADFLKPGDPSPAEVHPTQRHTQWIYTIGLEPLATDGLKSVRPIGWRFLTGAGSGMALSAMVGQCNESEVPKLTGLSRGPKVTAAVHAAGVLRNLPEAKGGEFEVLVLTIPGLLIEAFWLKTPPDGAETDWFVPFVTISDDLHPMRLYKRADFLKRVQALATKQLDLLKAAAESPSRPPGRLAPRGRARIANQNSKARTTSAASRS